MTGDTAVGPVDRGTSVDPDPDDPPGRRVVWWRRPWIVPLALVVLTFLVYQLSPFRHLDESRAPLPPHDGFPLYFPILITHMFFGTIAMITVVLQVWPWLRKEHPRVHRVSGRLYVVSTVVSAVLALSIVGFAPVVGQVGVTAATLTWLGTTVMGFIRARQRQFEKHRRLMLYSFAVVMNNVWGVILGRIGFTMIDTIDLNYVLESVRWLGWVGNLMLVQWWLNRTEDRRRERRGRTRLAEVSR